MGKSIIEINNCLRVERIYRVEEDESLVQVADDYPFDLSEVLRLCERNLGGSEKLQMAPNNVKRNRKGPTGLEQKYWAHSYIYL